MTLTNLAITAAHQFHADPDAHFICPSEPVGHLLSDFLNRVKWIRSNGSYQFNIRVYNSEPTLVCQGKIEDLDRMVNAIRELAQKLLAWKPLPFKSYLEDPIFRSAFFKETSLYLPDRQFGELHLSTNNTLSAESFTPIFDALIKLRSVQTIFDNVYLRSHRNHLFMIGTQESINNTLNFFRLYLGHPAHL